MQRMPRSLSRLAGLLTVLAVGCQQVRERPGMLEREAAQSNISSHQLQVMVNEFVSHYAHRVEMTADQVLSNEFDSSIRRNALLWKINGISACFQAASRQDPLGAFLDLWILNKQMTEFFHSEHGRNSFGDSQQIAWDTCAELEGRLSYIYQTVGTELQHGEQFVARFATDFPLTNLYFDREPIASRYIEEIQEPSRELFQVVADLDKSLAEMRSLSAVYAEYLPKQARWEAQLLLLDTTQMSVVQQPLDQVSIAAQSVARMADTAESLPQLIESERRALRSIVQREREETLGEIEQMRRATVTQVQQEREVVLAAVTHERTAIQQQLQAELTRTIAAADDISRHRVEQIADQMPAFIDHMFWRLCQLISGVVLVGILAWFGKGLWRVLDSISPVESYRLQRRQNSDVGVLFDEASLSPSEESGQSAPVVPMSRPSGGRTRAA